jgi:transcriptional regulator with XRE-family HTH domain
MSSRNATLSRLGTRLRELREERGLSVRTLAARAGFSPSFISQIEIEAVSPSLASLERVADELGVTLGELFSSLEEPPRVVLRRDERAGYESAWSKSAVEVLADAAPRRKMSVVQVTLEPGGASGKRAARSSHETFALVLSGSLVLTTEEDSVELREGDTAYLPEGSGVLWENRSEEPAELVMVGTGGRPGIISDLLGDEREV